MASTATSTSAVLSTLVANLILFGIFILGFLILRLKYKRIYSPKSSFELVPEDQRPEPLPRDPFRWIFILLTKPNSFIIQQAGIDGYFFLRYVFSFACVFLVGMLTWTVLLPINATNGKGATGLDQLAISNVKDRNRYYAHVFIGWVFYGGVIFVIYRELFLYNSLRSAVLASPKYSKKLSSRTVLFQTVPDSLLDEKQLYKMFNGVKRIFVARTARDLESKVAKRDALVKQLENAQNKLLATAVKNKMKAEKKGQKLEPVDEISAYVPQNKRPRHKSGGFFSKKIDTINYCKEEIPKIDKEVRAMQKKFRTNRPKNSIFVEFEDQYHAQLAYQATVHHNPLRMKPVFTGVEPGDVQWSNLRMFWWERITRRFLAFAAVVALIILWAVPVAFVGVISNITYLTNKLPWLRWILNMPHFLLGIITGLLPAIMLALLMMILPMFIRGMAKIAGAPTYQAIELYTQNVYFAFLMINGFLVTALASSATSTVTQIIEEPTSAMSILANNLPKSSNFYISYIILQGLSVASGSLFQIVGLILFYLLGRLLDNTVRKKWNRFSGLGSTAWGTTFPVFTNITCIALIYSIISPMIMLFACVALFLIYIAFCHNLTYVLKEGPDTRGLHYPRALFQTFTGIYIGQVCLLGIFAVGKGWGPIVLQIIGIFATVFIHINLNESFDHLLQVVPIDCMRALDGVSQTASFTGSSEYKRKVLDRKTGAGKTEKAIAEDKEEQEQIKRDILQEDGEFNDGENERTLIPLLADRDFKTTESQNVFVRFVRPDVFLNYRHAKQQLPATYNIEPETEDDKHAYDMPVISAPLPGIWIPADPMGFSKQQIEEFKGIVSISDENSGFDEKGAITFLGEAPN
ncbi:predicted protein [Scheffersomyces stipitis CBS 6054]|uniref:DUF221-domain-containing protein n=1 Tax=Scheffersomyces stipitis (strain ATCC 58785 / CBS 6054 / NBRC 10063 / NRRL Y-11545) TaxID=322104 RepID=A3LQ78_PICST|nr:predicted protein [Scheffersomyces stipitis CBS 6054]ABN64633.1 predicted protein [Scheffersomyces stipitis CBS 6054]KAG2736329.1 hypothetical protein G9P44_000419 [Scheffersomyces stipitis]